MNIVFFGSSKHSVIVAEKLQQIFGLKLVVTKPGPVETFAKTHKIPYITPEKLIEEIISTIARNSIDFLVVADYGLILPKTLLALPTRAPLNVHHSLLPKYRGPTPAPSAILNGEKTTGVSIIVMGDTVDTGDILAQKEYDMKPDETTDSLLTTLNTLGAELIAPIIAHFDEYYKKRIGQDDSQATYTPRLTRENGYIQLEPSTSSGKNSSLSDLPVGRESKGMVKLERMIRAYYPWPGVWTSINIKGKTLRVKLLPNLNRHSGPLRQSVSEASLSRIDSGVANAPQNDKLLIQVEGKKPVSVKDFLNGYPKEGKILLEKLGII